jgi:hypothetical protein
VACQAHHGVHITQAGVAQKERKEGARLKKVFWFFFSKRTPS